MVCCRKNGIIYEIEIEGFDEDCEGVVRIITEFIKKISMEKSVFIEIAGEKDVIDKNAIISCAENSGHLGIHRMKIDLEKVDDMRVMFSNMFTSIFIFEQSIAWYDVADIRNISSCIQFEKLEAFIGIKDLDGIQISIKEDYADYVKNLFEELRHQQFSIRMKKKIWNELDMQRD